MGNPLSQRVALVQLQSPDGTWHDVGYLVHANEITRFESSREYWELPERPVLGQIFEERGRDWRPSQRIALPTWFSHLLPEGYLRSAVSAAIGVNAAREFLLLVRIGEEDLPGAVRVILSEDEGPVKPESADYNLHYSEKEAEDPILKFSLAGLQPKFSVLLDPERGLTIPARGQAGDWILKLPDGRVGFDGVPEAEYASLELARQVGINVPPTQLVDISQIDGLPRWARTRAGQAFAINRFDRTPDGGRVHAEVLAQVLEVPTGNEKLKYIRANFETVASIVGGLCGLDAVEEVIDRLVFNVLIGNGDAHLKNWAITYPDGITPALSPAYDILPTVLYIPDDDLGLKLDSSRKFVSVTVNSFDRLASRVGLEVREARRRVLNMVEAVEAHWDVIRPFLAKEQYQQLTVRRDALPLFRQRHV